MSSPIRSQDVPSPLKRPAYVLQLRLQSQLGEIAISTQRDCNLVSTSMGAPFNEFPCSYEKDRHAVFINVGSNFNRLAKQEKRDNEIVKSKSLEKL